MNFIPKAHVCYFINFLVSDRGREENFSFSSQIFKFKNYPSQSANSWKIFFCQYEGFFLLNFQILILFRIFKILQTSFFVRLWEYIDWRGWIKFARCASCQKKSNNYFDIKWILKKSHKVERTWEQYFFQKKIIILSYRVKWYFLDQKQRKS